MAKWYAVARYAALMTIAVLMVGASLSTVAPVAKTVAAETQPKTVVYDTSTLKPGQVMTPWGPTDAKNVHEYNGTTINVDAILAHDGIINHSMRNKHNLNLPADGWNEWADYSYSSGITAFSGYWKVPAAPTLTYSGGQVLYLFNGLEPSDGSVIIQPVLQYGYSPAGGGNAWRLASWMVAGTQYWVSSLVSVSTNDIIVGSMSYASSTTWTVQGTDLTTNQSTTLTASTSRTFTLPDVTLETYSLPTTCAALSGNTDFYNLKLNLGAVTPSWTQNWDGVTWCHVGNPTITSSSEVLIHEQS